MNTIITPKQILQRLENSIVGQEEAKRAVALALWKQQLRACGNRSIPLSNLLIYGPSGCGKTALIRVACNIVGLPFLACDSTSITETGYKGSDIRDIVKQYINTFHDNPAFRYGVIFFDEIDKLAARGQTSRREYNSGTQTCMLRLIEGERVEADKGAIDTKTLMFIFGGAFRELKHIPENASVRGGVGFGSVLKPDEKAPEPDGITIQDFIEFGMETELMGRIGQCVPVRQLTHDELRRILVSSSLSHYCRYQRFFASQYKTIPWTDKDLDDLVTEAEARGLGARGLNALVEEKIAPLLLDMAEEMACST